MYKRNAVHVLKRAVQPFEILQFFHKIIYSDVVKSDWTWYIIIEAELRNVRLMYGKERVTG